MRCIMALIQSSLKSMRLFALTSVGFGVGPKLGNGLIGSCGNCSVSDTQDQIVSQGHSPICPYVNSSALFTCKPRSSTEKEQRLWESYSASMLPKGNNFLAYPRSKLLPISIQTKLNRLPRCGEQRKDSTHFPSTCSSIPRAKVQVAHAGA